MHVYYSKEKISIFLFHGCSTVRVGLDFLIVEVSISHSVRHSSVGVLWTGDRPVAETST
jgi:hypothetical protein